MLLPLRPMAMAAPGSATTRPSRRLLRCARSTPMVGASMSWIGWLLQNPKVTGLFNVGTGAARSFLDLVNAVGAAVGRSPKIRFVDTPAELRDKYQYFTQAD